MQNTKPQKSPGQLTPHDFALYESMQRQAEFCDYAFVDGSLIHWPSAQILDLHDDPIVINVNHNYTELLNEVRRYRRQLERIRPGKTEVQRAAIVACAAIQRTFSPFCGGAYHG